MKKVILTLSVCLSCIMIANAKLDQKVVDTLEKRIVNGLEIMPIRTTYESGEIFWKLRASDFKKCFQKFESKYPGDINYNLESKETVDVILDWEDHIWETIVPTEIKALQGIDIRIFVDKEGRVFTAEFLMADDVFQKLNTFPPNTLKNLYHNLIREKCKAIKEAEFHSLDENSEYGRSLSWAVCGSMGVGKEYVTIKLSWFIYYVFGTCNLGKLSDEEKIRMLEEKNPEKAN